MKENPDLSGVPAQVRRLLESCLEKNPKKRLRDIGDAWLLLEDAPEPPHAAQGTLRWLWPAVAAVLFLSTSLLLVRNWRSGVPSNSGPGARLTMELVPAESLMAGHP